MNKKTIRIMLIIFTFLFMLKPAYAEDAISEESFTIYEENEVEKPIEISDIDPNYKLIIEDDANLLSDDEKIMLEEKMKSLLEYGNIAFVTIDKNTVGSAASFASNYYHNKFGTGSGSLFLIDMDTRNIYIFSDGNNYRIITRDKAYIITDNIYTYATAKQYYLCAYEAFDEMEILLNGGKILEPMRYASNIVISITLGAFVAFFIAVKMTSIKKVSEKEIINMMNSHLILNSIEAKKTGTHKVYSPVSDSGSSGGGSSGGGGGGGGGGGSSGGGGGHSF